MKRQYDLTILVLVTSLLGMPSFASTSVNVKDPAFQKQIVWNLTDGIENPESVYLDPPSGKIFVSNVAGNPSDKDSKGWISLLSSDGKVVQPQWISGLHAPKGMRSRNGILYVSDIDQVIAIDIRRGRILNRTRVPGAKFLNDTAISDSNDIYVSDTLGSAIYRIEKNKPTLFVKGEDWESPNGLLVKGQDLIVASWGYTTDWTTSKVGTIYKVDLTTRRRTAITGPVGNLDGLESDGANGYFVSDWVAGKVYRVSEVGEAELLYEGMNGSADLFYWVEKKQILIPRMNENSVSAFNL